MDAGGAKSLPEYIDSEMQKALKCQVLECEVLRSVEVSRVYRLRDAGDAGVLSVRV